VIQHTSDKTTFVKTIVSRVNLTICVSLYLNDRNIGEFFVNVGHDGAVNAKVDGTCEQCNDTLGVGYPNICCSFLDLLVHHYPALILPSSSQV
jgi:hypothetical protein